MRTSFKAIHLAAFLALSALVGAASGQSLDDTLESELDEMSTGGAAQPAAPAPGPVAKVPGKPSNVKPVLDDLNFDDEPPLEDPLANETAPAAPVAKTPAPKKIVEPKLNTPEISLAPPSDEPNSAFEARLARIYSQNAEPVSEEKWTGLLGSRTSESYSVQAGDTLWDLSQTLFADGFYWSKLWAENPEIQNPHQISKGQAIRFIEGTEASPPEVRVVKDEPQADLTVETAAVAMDKADEVAPVQEIPASELVDIDVPISPLIGKAASQTVNQAPYYQEDVSGKISQADLEAGIVVEQSEIVPRPPLPPPTKRRSKVMLNIPHSFKEATRAIYDKSVTIQRRNRMAEKIPAAVSPGFMAFDSAPEPMGKIAEVDQGEVASIGQNVVIQGNEPIAVGSRVYSLQRRYDVKSPANGKIGYAYELGGMLQITAKIDDKENLYSAEVLYAVNPLRVGSDILLGEIPRIQITTKGRRFTPEMIVVGGGDSDQRRFFGDGSVIFLDTQSGATKVGDILAVQARRGERGKRLAPDQSSPIGILKVFAVKGTVASAFVILATSEVYIGDRTGAAFPERLPNLRVEAPHILRQAVE